MLLTNKPIAHVQDLMPTLDAVMKSPRPLVIFAEKVDGAALGMLVQNNQHGTLEAVAVRAPGFGHRRIAHLHDLAAFTGGQVIADEAGLTLEHVKPRDVRQRAPRGHHRRLDRARRGRRHRRAGRGAARPDPHRARAGDPGHRHRGPARAPGQAVEQARRDPRRRRHRPRAQGEAPPHRGRAGGDPGRACREGIVAGGGTALLRAEAALDDSGLEGDYLRGVEVDPRRPRRAAVLGRDQRRLRRPGGDRPGARDARRPRPERAHRRVRRPVRDWRDRPGARSRG